MMHVSASSFHCKLPKTTTNLNDPIRIVIRITHKNTNRIKGIGRVLFFRVSRKHSNWDLRPSLI